MPPQWSRIDISADKWFLTLDADAAKKLEEPPSLADGLEPEIERELRLLGCELIQSGAILLRLPQTAAATGQILFQRYYYQKSFVRYNMVHTVMAALLLASRIEEAPRRPRDVINVVNRLKQLHTRRRSSDPRANLVPLKIDKNYVELKNLVIKTERRILNVLGFVVHVHHPHKLIYAYMFVLQLLDRKDILQRAWNYMNDGLRTDIFMRYRAETIACACIFLAARTVRDPVPLPKHPRHWFELYDATEEEIHSIASVLMELYEMPKVPDLIRLNAHVEKLYRAKYAPKIVVEPPAPPQQPPEVVVVASPAAANGNATNATADERRRSSRSAERSRRRQRSRSRSPTRRRSRSPSDRDRDRERDRSSRGRERAERRRRSRSRSPQRSRPEAARRDVATVRMPADEESVNLALQTRLIRFYQDLVRVEVNDPIHVRSSFLGVKQTRKVADLLAGLQPEIPPIGDHGVFTDGVPFYHYRIQNLKDVELKRLAENDVRLKTSKFTPEEDEQLHRNWADYCELAGVDPEEAPAFMGCSTDGTKKRGCAFFRPWMCRGLPHRSGVQVYRRCALLFHPANEEGANRAWTKDECLDLLQLGPAGNWAELGQRFNRPRHLVHKQYLRLVREGVPVEQRAEAPDEIELKLLYKTISRAFRKDPVRAFVDGQLETLQELLEWEQIAEIVGWPAAKCRQVFNEIKESLEEAQGRTFENQAELIKHYRKALPRPCRSLCRLQNKKKPAFKMRPKDVAAAVKLFYRNHDAEMAAMRPPHLKFAKALQNSPAFAAYTDEQRRSIGRRFGYVYAVLHERGVFDFLPLERRDFRTNMKLMEKILKQIPSRCVKTRQVHRLAKEAIEKWGLQPARTAFAHKSEAIGAS
ncbi:hypothetical protein M3Y99_01138600 [Aphelenchoides fujianensis]|nr:hypothetical protein M3Y99_01138600 [Aphelenchoides fujianensis]